MLNREQGAEPPLTWWIGRLCEEFPALSPRTAYHEWRAAPVGWFEEIIEARAYARAKRAFDDVKESKDLQALIDRDPMVALVRDIEVSLVKAEIDAQERDAAAAV